MRLLAATLAIALIALPARTAADPSLLSLLPPGADIVGGVDVEAAKISPAVMFLLEQFAHSGDVQDLGFDVRRDLREIAVGGTKESGVIAARGSFPVAQILAKVAAGGVKTQDYRGVTLIQTGTNNSAAFLDATTALMGDTAEVQASVDRWVERNAALPELAAGAQDWSAHSQVWGAVKNLKTFAGTSSPNPSQQDAIAANVAAKIDRVTGGVELVVDGATMRATLETLSAQDAQSLSDVFQLVKAMVAPESPQAALLNSVQVTLDGASLHLMLPLDETQLRNLFPKADSDRVVASR